MTRQGSEMSFDDLPDLGPMMLPGAGEYSSEFLELAREASRTLIYEPDIAYGADRFQKLDVWRAGAPSARGLPVLIFIHGGAFRNGHKEWIGAMAPAITSIPAILVSPNYRLVPRVKVSSAVDDCLEALAWVHRNIARFGGDPDRIFVGGHSAGGHLATMLALRKGDLATRGISRQAIRGCIALSAVFSMLRPEHGPESMVSRFWDEMFTSEEDAARNTAWTYTDENEVPFYVAYGDDEPAEVSSGSDKMVETLQKSGNLFEVDRFQNCDHFHAHRLTLAKDGVWMRSVRRLMESAGGFRGVGGS